MSNYMSMPMEVLGTESNEEITSQCRGIFIEQFSRTVKSDRDKGMV